jgi:hypothetical protein
MKYTPLALLLLLAACGPAAPSEPATKPRASSALPVEIGVVADPPRPALQIDEALALSAAPWPVAEDLDDDGLDDAWEDQALALLTPVVVVTADEPFLDEARPILALGRVTPIGAPFPIRAFIALAYNEDYGTCGLSAHHGDSERVAIEIDLVDDVPRVTRAYTAAHEGTPTDRGQVTDAGDLDVVGGRWRVFSSHSKHATYPSVAACEDAYALPCLRERCEDAVALSPESVNAGEPWAPLVDDLTEFDLPGESAWADQRFCGGTREGGCSSPLVEKLAIDPF